MAAKTQKRGASIFYIHLISIQLHILNSFVAQTKILFLNEFGLCQYLI